MKKLFFLLLAFPLFFAACSDDDKEEVAPGIAKMTLTGEATASNKIELEWSKVKDTYWYQVFFQAEGETEWQKSNFAMATVDQATTVRWDGGDFTYFNEDVKYTIYVKAFRDSQENSVIGESNKIEVETFSDNIDVEIDPQPEATIVGKWSLRETQPKDVLTNDYELEGFIRNYFTHVVDEGKYGEHIEFKEDGTFVSMYEGNGTTLEDSGEYFIKEGILTMAYKIIESIELEEDDVHEYKLGGDPRMEIHLISEFNKEEYSYLINLFNKENPKEGLSISRITFVETYVRL